MWGPQLWKILHGIGETAGYSKICHTDEIRELQWIINNLEKIVPCRKCSRHIQEYRRIVPFNGNYKYWFWNFHEAVNARLGKIGVPFDTLRGNCNIMEEWAEYEKRLRGKIGIDWKDIKMFKRHLQLWLEFSKT